MLVAKSVRWARMTAILAMTSCAAAPDPADEHAGSESSDASASGASESVGDDGIEVRVTCSNSAESTATDVELTANALADHKVGLDLLGQLGSQEDNVLLSPLSLRTAFGQVYAGASGASRTEIENVLGFAELGERTHDVLGAVTQKLQSRNVEGTEELPAVVFRPANRSFFDVGYESRVNADWAQRVQESYGVCFEFFDMNRDHEKTLTHVNAWVAAQTNDMIPDLVKSLPVSVSLILVNALYFRASWQTPFAEAFTTELPFTARSGKQIKVSTMRAPLLDGTHASDADWEAVGLPYSDRRLEMVVIVPAANAATTFEADLDAQGLDNVFSRMAPAIVDLSLPKFDITSKWALRQPLTQLGMNEPFRSDFPGIAEGIGPIFEVFHDVAIAIDEKGTEAAAATAAFGPGGGEEPEAQHVVVVDRTFYIAIRDRDARSLLFFARIGDPSTTE